MTKIVPQPQRNQPTRLHIWRVMSPAQRWASVCRLYGAKWRAVQVEKLEAKRERPAA